MTDDRVDVDPLRDAPIEHARDLFDGDAQGVDEMGKEHFISPKLVGHRQRTQRPLLDERGSMFTDNHSTVVERAWMEPGKMG